MSIEFRPSRPCFRAGVPAFLAAAGPLRQQASVAVDRAAQRDRAGVPRSAAYAGGYETINGSGSSWASVALFQWANDVRPQGITINYNPDGSAQGRTDYIQGGSIDFAGTDPPFRNGQDKLAGTAAETVPWGYSYVPDTAGGTAFMYHLTVGGHLVTNLRLTPAGADGDLHRGDHELGRQAGSPPFTARSCRTYPSPR